MAKGSSFKKNENDERRNTGRNQERRKNRVGNNLGINRKPKRKNL